MIMPQIRTWKGWLIFALLAVVILGGGVAWGIAAAMEGVTPAEASAQADKLGFAKHGDVLTDGPLRQKMSVTFGKNCTGTLIIGPDDYARLDAQVLSGATVKSVTVEHPALFELTRNPSLQGCFS